MEKVVITKITRYTKNKEGQPYISEKTGQPYTRLVLLTKEYPKNSLYGFENITNSRWEVGESVEIEIDKTGKYWYFKMPPKTLNRKEVESMIQEARELLAEQMGELDERIAILETKAGMNKMDINPMAQPPEDEPELEI